LLGVLPEQLTRFTTMFNSASMNRFVVGLAFGACLLASNVSATPILVFGQTGLGSPVTGVASAGSTRITVSAAPITITGILSGSTPISALLNLDVTSIDSAVVSGGDLIQHFQGTFSIAGGGNNYLSGAFIDLVAGAFGGNALTLAASTPPVDHVSFTSSIIPMSNLGLERALSFAFSGVSPAVNICGTGTQATLCSFTAAVAGNMSANNVSQLVPLPEPSTIALLVLAFGLVGLRRR